MNGFLTLVSYTLAAMAGICFVGGLAVLSGGKEQYRESDIHARLCAGYKKEKTYYRRYLTECILTLRRTGSYGNDYKERGG